MTESCDLSRGLPMLIGRLLTDVTSLLPLDMMGLHDDAAWRGDRRWTPRPLERLRRRELVEGLISRIDFHNETNTDSTQRLGVPAAQRHRRVSPAKVASSSCSTLFSTSGRRCGSTASIRIVRARIAKLSGSSGVENGRIE